MNRLNIEQRAKILGCLVEGVSIRATTRLTDCDKKTVLRLLAEFGTACQKFHDTAVRNVKSSRIQCDEIWSFCYAKEKNVPVDCKGVFGFGDVWTWTALCADSKLIVSYHVGMRGAQDALHLMDDLRGRLANRIDALCPWNVENVSLLRHAVHSGGHGHALVNLPRLFV